MPFMLFHEVIKAAGTDHVAEHRAVRALHHAALGNGHLGLRDGPLARDLDGRGRFVRSEEHTSELQSLMRNSYAVFCLKKKKKHTTQHIKKSNKLQNTQHNN